MAVREDRRCDLVAKKLLFRRQPQINTITIYPEGIPLIKSIVQPVKNFLLISWG